VISLVLAASLASAAPNTGHWVEPETGSLSVIFGARWKINVAEFQLLGSHPEEWSRPYVSEDGARAFAGARTGTLYGVDLHSGETLFERKGLGEIGWEMAEFRGLLVLGSDQDLIAVDQQIGETRFSIAVGGRMGGPMTLSGTVAYVPVRPNVLVAVDLVDKKELWRKKRATPEGISVRGQAKPVLDAARGVIYVGYSDGALMALDAKTGEERWTSVLGKSREFFADVDAAPLIVDGGKALIAASYNGGLYKLDAETGRTQWKQEQMRITGIEDVGSGLLVASDGDGQVVGLYRATGTVRWRYRLKHGSPTAPVSVGRQLVAVGSSGGPIAFLEVDTGRPKQLFSLGGGISVPPAYRDPELLVLSNQGAFIALRYGQGISVD
jgi:outer membrane protein assembly factor BamB